MIDHSKLPYRPCAGVMLANRDGRVFVGQRLDTTSEAWQMPQGGIDDGEEAEEAAIRELGEATGVHGGLVEIIARSREESFYDLPYQARKSVVLGMSLSGRVDIGSRPFLKKKNTHKLPGTTCKQRQQ